VAAREVAAGRLPARGALRAALPIQLVSVLAAAALTVVLTVVWGPDGAPPGAVALTVLFVVVGGMNNLWAELLRGTGRVLLEGGLEIASTAVLVVAGILVVQHGGSVTALAAVVAGKEAAVLLVSWAVLRPRRHPGVQSRPLLKQGMWIAVGGTAVVLLNRVGMVVVGSLGSVGALATYVVATRFLDAGATIAHTVGFGLGPGMAALSGDPAAFRSAARKYVGLITLLGVAVAVLGVLVAGPLTTIPFGPRWETAVPAVRVVALAGLPLLLSYVLFTVLMARNQLRWLALSAVAAAVVGLGTSTALVLARPTALSAVIGTTVGVTTLAVLLLAGLRDLLRPLPA
jgi:O-antigen/teichoic acid export membrane protein